AGCATSMIDTSDGFLGDLGHICQESGVGAELIQKKLPVSEYMKSISPPQGQDLYDMVMNDSDDYELIVTCSSENIEKVRSIVASVSDTPVTEVGRITEAMEGIKLILTDGSQREIIPTGWDHFSGKGG
ncbi:thiamine-monophosphate kinase, partial [Thermodesulfobacteriota bacterium]